jgi:hypothetical protein
MIRKIKFIILAFAFTACGSQKKATVIEVLPGWVQKKPIEAGYYIGIGSAQKNPGTTEYLAAAKNDALADLASEISITISSNSVLNQFESSLGYTEDFTAATKMATQQDIEGYEMVNSFDSEHKYYVYYRLSKSLHEQLTLKKRNEAIAKGLDYYTKAIADKSNNNYKQAIANYLNGLDAVKAYLSESLETNFKDKTILLGNELFNGLLSLVSEIRIVPNKSEIQVKNGSSLSSEQLTFTITQNQGKTLEGLPIDFSFGKKPLRNNKTESNADGLVSYAMSQVVSVMSAEKFIASLDANALATQFTKDPQFRKMMRSMKVPQGSILIQITNPSFYVSSIERNMGRTLDQKNTALKMRQLLTNNGFPVVGVLSEADYSIEIDTRTSHVKTEGKMHYAGLSGSIKVFNREKQLIFVKPLEQIIGVQLNDADAGLEAYKELADYMSQNFISKLSDALK